MLAKQRLVEPIAIRLTHEQFDHDGGIKVHVHHPRPSRSARTSSSAGGPPCTGCESRNSPIPVNRFRAWLAATGDSVALGMPSVVIVTCCPRATNSSKAESFALATRKGMTNPMPGMAAVSFKTVGSVASLEMIHLVERFAFII